METERERKGFVRECAAAGLRSDFSPLQQTPLWRKIQNIYLLVLYIIHSLSKDFGKSKSVPSFAAAISSLLFKTACERIAK